ACPTGLDSLHVQAGYASPLAPRACRSPLDVCAPETRTTADRALAARADCSSCAREPALGLQADRRRAEGPRRHRVVDVGAQGAARGGSEAGAAARAHVVASLPAGAGHEHARL